MDPKYQSAPRLQLVSTSADSTIKVDIIHGLSGYEFSRLRLTALPGSTIVWTNRTAVSQVVQLNDQNIQLGAGGSHGATAFTRFSEAGQVLGRLRSNPSASITFTITNETKL